MVLSAFSVSWIAVPVVTGSRYRSGNSRMFRRRSSSRISSVIDSLPRDHFAGALVDMSSGATPLHPVVAHQVVQPDRDPLDAGFLDLAHRGLRELAALADDALPSRTSRSCRALAERFSGAATSSSACARRS